MNSPSHLIGSPSGIARLFAQRLLTTRARSVIPLIPDVLLVDGLLERELDLKAVADGRFNFRNEIHCTVLLSLNLRWPQKLWQGGRSIAVYRISLDGRGGGVVSLAQNSPKITLHGFERTIQPKTLDMSSLRYSYVVLHHVLAFTLT